VADGVSSRMVLDRATAIDRMREAGAFVSTHESILFELIRDTSNPHFKAVSKLIREVLPPMP
jgi:hypothetical protein